MQIFVCSGQTMRNSPITTVILDTLLSWTLLIQVAVTGSDISLYSTGAITYMLVSL